MIQLWRSVRDPLKMQHTLTHDFRDYTSLVSKIGIHYQVRDDYMNLQSKQASHKNESAHVCLTLPVQYANNKGFCEDLTEGKFSFPIIHSIRADPSNRQLLNILQKRSNSVELKQYALQLLERTQTFAYCRQYLTDLEARVREEIQDRGGNIMLEKIMDSLAVRED